MSEVDQERFAAIVAENVVSAYERFREEQYLPEQRAVAVAGFLRELLAVMPTTSGAVLATACNRHLSTLPDHGWFSPRVETIDIIDGSVTLEAD
ncbi:hypothetical protein [Methylobacterium sp. NEAU K]|uniref:hypothetical protein n=1 Tax=Methylobacterium sp. NEAU K TaxID=3064946 RepID=UPI0027369AD0|nr:hypothetical protein [Methylobacterium sp. NEAU K]MDP4005637.1 hypothetical protein [Methylobacterium sp. NEAU K]